MMKVKSTSPSRNAVQAESIAFGGTVEEITIPVFRKRNFGGIILETIMLNTGERIESTKLTSIGKLYSLNFRRLERSVGNNMMKTIKKRRGVTSPLSDSTLWGLNLPDRYPTTIERKAHRRMYLRNWRLNLSMIYYSRR